jgi:uncharacterized membrane protein
MAHAQDTGGSIGGGDWGDEGGGSDWGSSGASGSDWGSSGSSGSDWGSSGSSGSDWGSSGSTDWGSSSSGSSSSTSSDWYGSGSSSPSYDSSGPYASNGPRSDTGSLALAVVLLVLFAGFVGILLFVYVIARQSAGYAEPTFANAGKGLTFAPRPSAAAMGYVDVSRLQLAVDWRARKFVQSELARLAKEASPSTPQGRAELLHAVARALASVQLAWLYAGARNFAPMPKAEAQQRFQSLANDARATYRQEVVRATDRVVTIDAVGVRAKESEGAGVVLVTVIVAARREIFDFAAQDAAQIQTLLRQLEALDAAQLVAIEIAWTPAVEEDRMSTAELEARHPGLVKIGGIGGRVFCGYCGGPHAAELEKCPHCGAPTTAT